MKTTTLTLALAGTIVGAVSAHAQFTQSFGPLTFNTFPQSQIIPALDTSSDPSTLYLNLVVGIQTADGLLYPSTFVPASGTPAAEEDYQVTVTGLTLTFSSPPAGIGVDLNPEPTTIVLPTIVFDFSYTLPVIANGITSYQIPYIAPKAIPTQTIPLVGSAAFTEFTVSWDSVSSVVVSGTKGVASYDARAYVEGEISVVPEPSALAMLAGLGLIGFSGWRRARR